MAAARLRTTGKHRKPRTPRRAAARRTPSIVAGTAVAGVAAAIWLPPTGSALGDVRHSDVRSGAAAASLTAPLGSDASPALPGSFRVTPAATAAGTPTSLLRHLLTRSPRVVREHPWVTPVVTYTLTAHFGEASGLWAHRHTGQDFADPTGTPVRAAGDAVVVSTATDGPYGNTVVLRHSDGTETWYCHLSAFLTHPGDVVTAGQVIGRVGATGNTTGPHLHFEVRPHGKDPVDPMPWLRGHRVRV